MALSEDQIRTAFRMLNIPYAGPVVLVDNLALNTTTFATYSSTTSAQTRLRAWLVGGAGQMDADSIIKAGAIIDSYTASREARGLEINNGGIGDVSGVTWNVEQQIDYLVGDLQNLVPFYKSLKDLADGGPSTRVTSCAVLM